MFLNYVLPKAYNFVRICQIRLFDDLENHPMKKPTNKGTKKRKAQADLRKKAKSFVARLSLY